MIIKLAAHAAAALCLLATAGCVSFEEPEWGAVQRDINKPADVYAFLGTHRETYRKMMAAAHEGKVALELPVLWAAVFGPVGVALGKGSDFALQAATLGIAGTAGSSYAKPGDRLKITTAAYEAVSCVQTNFAQMQNNGQALNARRAAINALAAGNAANERLQDATQAVFTIFDNAGPIALDAATRISSRTRVRLSDVDTSVDVAALTQQITTQVEEATAAKTELREASAALGAAGLTDADALRAQQIADYKTRIETCVSKAG